MLEELRITDLGVIEESVLELGPGFTVITGETGAGKTMVVTALGLLLGSRGDSGAVRTGARSARVEGVLLVDQAPAAAAAVEDAGGMVEEGRVVVARQLSVEGRSRAFAGGAGVPLATLTRVADALVAVHGQSDQHRLLRAESQREALDRFAGEPATRLREEFARDHAELRATLSQLEVVQASTRERAREAELLRFGLEEVERVAPLVGEDVELAAEEGRLGFADTLRSAAEQAREVLSSEDGAPDALGAVAAARKLLDGVREHDPQAAGLADRLAEVGYLLSDVAADVSSYATALETDPVRLAQVSERRAALAALTRKYGQSVDDVLAWAAHAAPRLVELEGTDGLVDTLRGRAEELSERLARTGLALSAVRREAADRLGERITEELRALAMPHAAVTVEVRHSEVRHSEVRLPEVTAASVEVDGRRLRMTSAGIDEVELQLAANVGAAPRPLAKGASGGELSRVMLGLEVALAGTDPVPTFVFDEVDAGVGGKAAVEVGRRLAMLARGAQVLVVTHLPQVAAFADRHVVVAKSHDGRVTRSGLTVLDEEGRLRELSRMLAGLEDSETARAHAEELLKTARTGVAPRKHDVRVSR